ncbi:hypothetical protein BH11PAT1_BH11PAT1_0240 [soil metagenome]
MESAHTVLHKIGRCTQWIGSNVKQGYRIGSSDIQYVLQRIWPVRKTRYSAWIQDLARILRKRKLRIGRDIIKFLVAKPRIALYLLVIFLANIVLGDFIYVTWKQNHPSATKQMGKYWEIPNTVHQVLAAEKPIDINLKENKAALQLVKGGGKKSKNPSDKEGSSPLESSNNPQEEVYRWEVALKDGTVFSFGLQKPEGILPVVRVRNTDGWYVRYIPKSTANYVSPKVHGNVIEWEISPGITARYTMQQDRVKADYIVNSISNFPDHTGSTLTSDQSQISNSYHLDFLVTYNHGGTSDPGKVDQKVVTQEIQGGKGKMTYEEMPQGDIGWFGGGSDALFTFPKPIIKEGNKIHESKQQEWDGVYKMVDQKSGESLLSIVLPRERVEKAQFPLIVDPALVIAGSSGYTDHTAFGNQRKLFRDQYGNLIVILKMITNDVYYKNSSSTSWTNASVELDGNVSQPTSNASDTDSSGNIHVVFKDNVGTQNYIKLAVTRDGSNNITSIVKGTKLQIDAATNTVRPSLIVANKGGGAGVEKVVVAYALNATSRGEIRVMQCSVSTDCTTSANWKNTSAERNTTGSCSDTSSTAANGLPNAATCKGIADAVFNVASTTTYHAVLTQIPGAPKRSPTNVKKDANSVFSDLTSTYDNNAATNTAIGTLSSTTDYLYVGDTTKFSKVIVDVGTVNATVSSWTAQYYNGTTWVSLANVLDNARNTMVFQEDGSLLFDEPSDWVSTAVNSTTKYWIRLRPSVDLPTGTTINEFYLSNRNARSLLINGGYDASPGMGASYVPWDEIANDRWENNPAATGDPWRSGASALDASGSKWSIFTTFPLTATIDPINNTPYVAYMSGTVVGSSDPAVKKLVSNSDPTVAANWTSTSFPAEIESAITTMSLTSDGKDIYLFYILNSGTNGLVYRKYDGSNWSSAQQSFVNFVTTTEIPIHPQVIVSKAFGDTIAIDAIYTNNKTAPAVEYERQYVSLADQTKNGVASGDDVRQKHCDGGGEANGQDITTLGLGHNNADGACTASNAKYHAGFRFPSVVVSQGAKVSSAYIDIRVKSAVAGTLNFTIYGEDADNSAAYTTVSGTLCNADTNCVDLRTRTTSSSTQAVSFVTNTYRFDVTNMVQEIVCRGATNSQPCVGNFNKSGTWASGNALSLLFIATDTSGAVNIIPYAFDDTPEQKPTLQINVTSGGKSYSAGEVGTLPTGYTNLDHPLSNTEYIQVSTTDQNYYPIPATTAHYPGGAYPVFQFKSNNSNNNNTFKIDASVTVQSSMSAVTKNVYLQVYRGGSANAWQTQATNSTAVSNTDFTLTATTVTTSLSEYYFNETPGVGTQYAACTTGTTNCWSYWRVYQDPPGTNSVETLSIDSTTVTYSANGPSSMTVTGGSGIAGSCNLVTVTLNNLPAGTDTIQVSSNSSGTYGFSANVSCTSPTSTASLSFTTADTVKTIYYFDQRKGTPTLTATQIAGIDTISNGTGSPSITAGAATKLLITLPGETFTDGGGNTGTPTVQSASILFVLSQIAAVDTYNNVDTSYSGAKTLSYTGPSTSPAPSYTTAVSFSSGVSSTRLDTVLKTPQTVAISVDDGTVGPTASSLLTISPAKSVIQGGTTIRGGTSL